MLNSSQLSLDSGFRFCKPPDRILLDHIDDRQTGSNVPRGTFASLLLSPNPPRLRPTPDLPTDLPVCLPKGRSVWQADRQRLFVSLGYPLVPKTSCLPTCHPLWDNCQA